LNPRGRAQMHTEARPALMARGTTPLNPRGRARPQTSRNWPVLGLVRYSFPVAQSGHLHLSRPDFGSELQWLRYVTYAARGPDSATTSPGLRRRPTGAGTRTSNACAPSSPVARSGSTSALPASRLARSPAESTLECRQAVRLSGLDDDRDDHRSAAVRVTDPLAELPSDHLLKPVRVVHALP
jgi:hypothetical protein